MGSHKLILKKVGIALVIVGLIDIGFFIYCIKNEISYSSSFNIFSVVAGIFLLRGSLGAAKNITFFAAFMLTAFIGLIIMLPFMEPIELRVIAFKLSPLTTILTYLISFFVLGFVYWVYRNLSSEVVMEARKNAGLSYGTPKLAFGVGGVLVVGLSIAMYFTNNGTSAAIAKSKALEKFGSEYKYHISGMSFAGNSGSARLKAYRMGEIKNVRVEW